MAISLADGNGNLPVWLVSATTVAEELGLSVAEAQGGIQSLWATRMTMGVGAPRLMQRSVA